MSGLTLPSLAAGALGRVSANTSRPGGPDQAGTGAWLCHPPAGHSHPYRT